MTVSNLSLSSPQIFPPASHSTLLCSVWTYKYYIPIVFWVRISSCTWGFSIRLSWPTSYPERCSYVHIVALKSQAPAAVPRLWTRVFIPAWPSTPPNSLYILLIFPNILSSFGDVLQVLHLARLLSQLEFSLHQLGLPPFLSQNWFPMHCSGRCLTKWVCFGKQRI